MSGSVQAIQVNQTLNKALFARPLLPRVTGQTTKRSRLRLSACSCYGVCADGAIGVVEDLYGWHSWRRIRPALFQGRRKRPHFNNLTNKSGMSETRSSFSRQAREGKMRLDKVPN